MDEVTTTLLDTPYEDEAVLDMMSAADSSEYYETIIQELHEIKEIESRTCSLLEIIAVALILFIVFRAAFGFLNIFRM